MKTITYILFFIFSFCLQSAAKTHTVKIQSPEYIQVNPVDTVLEVEDGYDLSLQIKFLPVCFGADLGITVNGENLEALKIDQENFEANIGKITENTEIVLSVVPVVVEGEIVYEETSQRLSLCFPVLRDLGAFIYTRYRKVNDDWELDTEIIDEPVPYTNLLRNEDERLDEWQLWFDSEMSPDSEYYVEIKYFRRHLGYPLVITTAISPVFSYNNYIVSNISVNKSTINITTRKGIIHIQTDTSPHKALIYTISGKLVKNIQLPIDETEITVASGIYVIIVDDNAYRVVVE